MTCISNNATWLPFFLSSVVKNSRVFHRIKVVYKPRKFQKKLFLYNIFQRRGNKGVFFIPPWQKCPSPGIFYFQFGQFYVKIMSSWGVEGGKGVQDLDFHKITIYLLLARNNCQLYWEFTFSSDSARLFW